MSFISNITSRLLSVYESHKRELVYKEYRDVVRYRSGLHGWDIEQKANGEDEYINVWQRLCPRVDVYTYRYFSHFMNKNPYIVPEDLGRTYIEYYLNPIQYRAFYSDKNLYDQYITPKELFPKVFYRRIIGSSVLDAQYQPVNMMNFHSTAKEFASAMPIDKAVLKKTNDSGGGRGVQCIERGDDGLFYSNFGNLVDGQFLKQFARDWNIQEAIEQHPFFSFFSETSLNTMRLYAYRSVNDESIIVYNAILRIGQRGSFLDNLTQGGGFVKIDVKTGKLGNKVYSKEGFEFDTINGIDFTKEYIVPFWKDIIETAKNIVRQIHHCHMVALDMCIDSQNNIRMIEQNIGDNSYRLSHIVQVQPFGDRIQEVIDYCVEQKKHDSRFRYINK